MLVNSRNTDPESYKEILKKEPYNDIMEAISSIPLLEHFINPKRKKARDLPKDEKGRVIPELPNIHILEDMDFFRQRAIYHEKHKKYTKLFPNSNKNSQYYKFWEEEKRRCIEGYIRPSDGEWITGYYYYYLNYCPIMKTIITGKDTGEAVQADRIPGFPDVWDGDYMYFHYIERGASVGKYGTVLKTRGRGFSYKAGGMLDRNITFFPMSVSYALASDTEYLETDGVLNKAWDSLDWINSQTAWGKILGKDTMMHKKFSYKDLDTGAELGYKSQIIGVTLKNNPNKARGKRGMLMLWEEAGCHIAGTNVIMYDGSYKNVEDVSVGDLLMGLDSKPRKVLETHSDIDDMYRIKPKNGIEQIVNSKHKIYVANRNSYIKKTINKTITPIEYLDEVSKNPKRKYNYALLRANEIKFEERDIKLDPYFIGLWLGDGESDRPSISSNDIEVINYLKDYAKSLGMTTKIRDIKGTTCKVVNMVGKYKNNLIKKELIRLNLLNNKHIPDDYIYNSITNRLRLLAGLIDSDGNYNKNKVAVEFTQHKKRKQIVDKFVFIARSLGMKVSRNKKISKTRKLNNKIINGGELNYRATILHGHSKIPTLIERKQTKDREGFLINYNATNFDIEYYGVDRYYGFVLDKDHLFLTEDFTITHNSFPNLLKSWKIAQKSLEDGNRVFGYMLAFGTGGDNESNFMSLEELFYKPDGYRVYSMINMFDKNAMNSRCAFFAPDYLNRADCYDDDGNSDVIRAISEVAQRRFIIKYNTSDPNAVTIAKAEEPWTPQEATARVTHSLFPIGELKDTLSDIKPNEETFLSSHYVGELVYIDVDNVTWHLDDSLHALRDYPIKDTNIRGALEIFELPKKGEADKPARGRYIIGVDPVDADTGTSMFSFFVFDLFTDNVVAEFTGRRPTANQNFELLIKAAIFYNAKINYENNLKGLFSYFDHKNLLYLLMDTPQILRDQELIKQIGYGNKAKGTPANKGVNLWARKLFADWLLTPYVTNAEKGEQKLNIKRLRSIGLLKEALYWNIDGNFDRISSIGMVMIAREQLYKQTTVQRDGGPQYDTDAFLEMNYSGQYDNIINFD